MTRGSGNMGSEGHMCSGRRVPPVLESFFQLKDKAGSKPVSVKRFLESFDCKSVFAPHNADVLGISENAVFSELLN